MSPKSYISYTAAVILQTLSNGYRHGFDIMDVTGLPSGTVYPALRRLEEAGLVASSWEKESVARREQRPARKYYDLTREGKEALEEAVTRYRLLAQSAPTATRKPKPERS
ncbi:MAG TPA: helix-turn-helix transcriptional regulator [Blastocatellia bacterium]|jgi:DNA-binding PadR family transcriptional regulator